MTDNHLPDVRGEALTSLRTRQQQLDMDGSHVGVSRQALEEVLAEFDRLQTENFALAANQCKAGYAGEHGDHMCHLLEALRPFADLGVGSGPDEEVDSQPYRLLRGAIRKARVAVKKAAHGGFDAER